MLYQSFSGDAETGTSSFNMTGGSITAKVGPMFYITNTDSVIKLKCVKLVNSSGILLTASADSWGTKGSNGGVVALKADSQTLTGEVTCDNISTVKLSLTNSSSLKGAINTKDTAKSISLSIDSNSKWTVTGTSYLTNLTDSNKTLSNIVDNGNTIYYNASSSVNSWLNGKTIKLSSGGQLTPEK